MNCPEDPSIPVDSSQVGIIGEESSQSCPEYRGSDTHKDGGDEDVHGVEDEEMEDEDAVGEGGEEQTGAGPQLGHQAGREEAGQGEGGVGEGCAAIKHDSRELELVITHISDLHEVRIDTEFFSILNCD